MLNERDTGGRTALYLAIMNLKRFNYRGEVNSIDNKEDINYRIIETLLEHGANVNCEEDKVLHYRQLRLAEEIKAWPVVEELLKKQADDRDLVWMRENVEKRALQEGYVNLVKFILKCGVSVQHTIMNESTMLHVAAQYGQLRLVQLLIEHGADVDISTGEHKTTPLMSAAQQFVILNHSWSGSWTRIAHMQLVDGRNAT
ncbi:hypothetical protein L9F63_006073, partial [Diploptera punctata]